MLLALVALAVAGLESVSFGHQHLGGGHALHHHHYYLASHEHPDAHHDDDRDHDDHDHDGEHDHDAPPPQDRNTPRKTATVSAAPALAQPVGLILLAAPLEKLASAVQALALPPVVRPLARLTPPRAPPAPLSPLRVS